MMLHAPVLALLLTAWLGAATLLWAAGFATTLLRHWDLANGARRQIELERRTHLVATLLTLVMGAQAVALPLMVFNADRTAPLLVGAMCAFGSFNASVYGFPALYAKLALFFGAGVWLAMHQADLRAPDYPLTRRKYAWLLALLPLALADAGLATAYFADLKADTLTSCCGSAFNPERAGVAAEAAALDPPWALGLLAAALAASLLVGALARRWRAAAVAYGAVSLLFLGVALLAVVAAISLYVYEHPHHHCPFCLLKREYGYIGFVLYTPLFAGAASGLAAGTLSWRVQDSLQVWLTTLTQRLRLWSMLGFVLFSALSGLVVWRSALRL